MTDQQPGAITPQSNQYAIRFHGKSLRYYHTREEADTAMSRSDHAVLWKWDTSHWCWRQIAMRVIFKAEDCAPQQNKI